MDDLVLNAICHIRNITKKKPNYRCILFFIQKSTPSNIDLSVVESKCNEKIEMVSLIKN